MHRRQIYLAAQSYACTPTVLFAGINYGAGSSRDWAAKVLDLLGIKAMVARSIERADGSIATSLLALRLDSQQELGYLEHGGVLPFVIRKTVQRTRQGALDD